MDELEVAFSHPYSRRTDCNHIFLNFVPVKNRGERPFHGHALRFPPPEASCAPGMYLLTLTQVVWFEF